MSRQLPRSEQQKLALQAASGDRRAAGTLIEASRGFIIQRVRRLGGGALRDDSSLEDDLYAEGCRGMFEALLRYDASRNLHPLTYCAHWIDLRIRNALALASGPASVGSPQHWREIGRPHTTAVGLEGVTDTLPDEQPTAEEALLQWTKSRAASERLHTALETLEPLDRRIIELRFLAEPADRLTLADVGRTIGLSRERTRQREIEALKLLLTLLNAPADRLPGVRRLSRS